MGQSSKAAAQLVRGVSYERNKVFNKRPHCPQTVARSRYTHKGLGTCC